MRLLFALFLFPLTALGTDWSDLEVGETIQLSQKVAFSESMSFAPPANFRILRAEPLSGLPVYYYEMQAEPCAEPRWEAEMVLVQPEAAGDVDRRVGVELAPGCQWNIWLELKDYYSPSLFVK